MNDLEKLANGYTYETFWSEEDQEYVGTCEEFKSLSFLDPDKTKALEGVKELVKVVIEDMIQDDDLLWFLINKKLQDQGNKLENFVEEKLKETVFYDIETDLPPVLRPSPMTDK